MKKYLITLIIMSLAFAGCNKIEPVIDENSHIENDCIVSFNPIGEISTSESILTRATMTDDIYLVQVYKGSECFALGYFDNLASMKVYLKQGAQYRIIVAMIKDAKNLLGSRFNLQQNSIYNYDYPDSFDFLYCTSTSSSASSALSSGLSYYYPLNRYQYAFTNKFSYYKTSSTTSLSTQSISQTSSRFYLKQIETACLNKTNYPECTDWFYGEVNNYTPTGSYETLDMTFRRVGFKLKYELSGVTDGEVTVKVFNNTRTFINNTTNTSTYSSGTQFIAFYDAKSAWQYADDYSENMTVSVVWKRGIGVTQDLGTKTVQIKRNCLNNIKIKLGNDDRGAGVSLTAEAESSMGSAENNIPVE